MYELVCLPVGRHIKEICAWQFHSLTCHTPRILGGGGEGGSLYDGGGAYKIADTSVILLVNQKNSATVLYFL